MVSGNKESRGCATGLDAEGYDDLFDQIARKNLNMSGQEFLRRWDAGEFRDADWDAVPGLLAVAMALPLAR